MVKKPNLATALQQASGKPVKEKEVQETSAAEAAPVQSQPIAQPASSTAQTNVPPSRRGKKAITGHFDPLVSKQLKGIALEEDRTVQDLLAEALNDLFVKYDKNPIA